jgi:myo-inositol-1(or 4)-monophosphatase
MQRPLDDPVLNVLHGVADEVALRLRGITDWTQSGRRDGQYRADVEVDDVAVDLLTSAGFAVLSEESGRSGDGDRIVVLDPLDGSTNASRGIGWYATSMCVIDDDGPAAALVANQATGERFEAIRGAGAWLGDRRLQASGCTEIGDAVVGVSGRPVGEWRWRQFRALGAAALDLALVAGGSLDGWVDMSTDAHGVWDYLGGVLLCSEAGAVFADAIGRELVTLDAAQRRTPIAAATPKLLDVLLARREAT